MKKEEEEERKHMNGLLVHEARLLEQQLQNQ